MSFDHGHALVIGVNNYPNVPGLNVAQTRADAEAVAAVLRYQQFCGYPESQVTLLVDIGATRGAILGALDALAGMVSDSDTVLLFYAGHGMYGADGAYYLSSSDVQIAPVDGKSKVVGGTGVSEAELITKLRAIKAQRVLLIFNACHSGAVSPTLGVEQQAPAGRNPPNETTAALLATGAGRIIITACRAAQYSYIGTGALTLFTQALVSGLLGQGVSGRNGYISAFDLYTHIYTTVSETVKNDYRGIQEPELTILKGVGPFAVALYRGATTLGAFDERAAPTPGVAVRPVSEDESRRAFERIVSVGQGVASGGDLTGGTVIGGNQTNAQGSQGFIGQATGP
ncbi:MAG TPA: caspase family protein, partial [Roseiflexaceae bacterium]